MARKYSITPMEYLDIKYNQRLNEFLSENQTNLFGYLLGIFGYFWGILLFE